MINSFDGIRPVNSSNGEILCALNARSLPLLEMILKLEETFNLSTAVAGRNDHDCNVSNLIFHHC